MKKLIITAALLWTLSANAANWYVNASASGARNGQNWNNAWANPSQIAWTSINPGDTIWIAGGSYGGFPWGKSGTATSRITMRRATGNNPECTSAAGWSSALDSQATISFGDCNGCTGIYMAPPTSDYVTIDGQIPNGIKIVLPAPTVDYNSQTTYQVTGIKATGNGEVFQYLEIAGSGLPQCAYGIMAGDNYHYGWKSGLSINHCYIHDVSTALIIGDTDSMTVEQCELASTPGNTYNHNNITYVFSGNYGVYRYNYIHDFPVMGLYFCAQYPPGPNHWKIYGNIFLNTAAGGTIGQGQAMTFDPSGATPFQYGNDFQIYNNTVAQARNGLRTDGRWPALFPVTVAGGSCYNNIFWGVNFWPGAMSHDYNFTDATSVMGETHGIASGSNPFVNLSGANLHIVSTTGARYPRNLGFGLSSEFATDRDGDPRGADGAWDIGAYEYGVGQQVVNQVPAPPTNLRILSVQ